MQSLTLNPIKQVGGTVNMPGSKSLSNRALLLAALAQGTTTIRNLLDSDDVHHMLSALKALGVDYSLSDDKTSCMIHGLGKSFSAGQKTTLFLGNAGTAMRPLCAALCAGTGHFALTGEPRMEERPIGALVDALREAGAKITYLKDEGYPPLSISAHGLHGGEVHIDGNISSQFSTAMLMAAPLAAQDTHILVQGNLVSKPYIDITIAIMKTFGVIVENDAYQTFTIEGGQQYTSPSHFLVEGDASSASYFLAAAAIKGGEVNVTGLGRNSTQGDILFAEVLRQMGAQIEMGEDNILARRGTLRGIDMDMNHIPDAAMTIAATALFAEGKTTIRNIGNWRVKETDRLSAMATELRKVGASVVEGSDYLEITPPSLFRAAAIDTYNDHRMAMCFALAALNNDNVPITINDPGCTTKTFPGFFEVFKSICQNESPTTDS